MIHAEKINQLKQSIFHKYLNSNKGTQRNVFLNLANNRCNRIIGKYFGNDSLIGLDPLFHSQHDRYEYGLMNKEEYKAMEKRNRHLYCFK